MGRSLVESTRARWLRVRGPSRTRAGLQWLPGAAGEGWNHPDLRKRIAAVRAVPRRFPTSRGLTADSQAVLAPRLPASRAPHAKARWPQVVSASRDRVLVMVSSIRGFVEVVR